MRQGLSIGTRLGVFDQLVVDSGNRMTPARVGIEVSDHTPQDPVVNPSCRRDDLNDLARSFSLIN